jgi:predicted nucleotidyltransferase
LRLKTLNRWAEPTRNMKPPTPYPALNTVLQEFVDGAGNVLGDNLIAAWLQGSFAIGGFDRHSDVDFVVAIDNELSDSQVRNLQAMHQLIHDLESEWAKHLEGSYFPASILRRYAQSGRKLWYLDHGSRELERSAHDNSVVVRWILREKGVVLAGPRPSAWIDPIPTKALRREILETINNWGGEILADPEQINNRFYQTFAVLSYSRMLHDLHIGAVGSKRAGAEWAKENLAPSWRGLIDRAWDGRPNPALSVQQPADETDFRRTLEFIDLVMRAANKLAART